MLDLNWYKNMRPGTRNSGEFKVTVLERSLGKVLKSGQYIKICNVIRRPETGKIKIKG